jgi:hypothetical protein
MRSIEPSEYWIYGQEAAELMQLRRDVACSFRENLIWLEEMTEFRRRFAKYMATNHPNFRKTLTNK